MYLLVILIIILGIENNINSIRHERQVSTARRNLLANIGGPLMP